MADANHLPFPDRYFANLVLFDVLHHLPRPVGFFTEAERVLQSGGRLVLMEPAITPVSRIFYTFLHPEPVVWDCDPLDETALLSGPAPLDANQAVPSLLFGRHRNRFEQRFPSLKVLTVRKTGLFAYPLSGGFRRWSLIPGWAAAALMRVEPVLEPVLGPVMAFRLHVVVERL